MENTLKPGPVQTAWLASLREHPGRQMSGALGRGTHEDYLACCLGELAICANNAGLISNVHFTQGRLINDYSLKVLNSWKDVGLLSETGALRVQYTNPNIKHINSVRSFPSLAAMNDYGMTWPEIADYVEANFDNVFTKSV